VSNARRLGAIAAVAALVTGCLSPDPVAGRWSVSRTASQPTGCALIPASRLDVTVDPGASHPIVTQDYIDFANGLERAEGTDLAFMTEEYFEGVNENGPILIGHTMKVVDDHLVGTASAAGDGDSIGCHWQMSLVGTRE
jgi:hypothetical protein